MCITLRQKINKESEELNNSIEKMDLTDIFRTFHPSAAEYTFISSTPEHSSV